MRKEKILRLEGRENCYTVSHNCWVKDNTIFYKENKDGTYLVLIDWAPFSYRTKILVSSMNERAKSLIKETLGLNTYYYRGFEEIRWVRI